MDVVNGFGARVEVGVVVPGPRDVWLSGVTVRWSDINTNVDSRLAREAPWAGGGPDGTDGVDPCTKDFSLLQGQARRGSKQRLVAMTQREEAERKRKRERIYKLSREQRNDTVDSK